MQVKSLQKDLLSPLDTLEMALKSADADLNPEDLLPKLKKELSLL